MAEEKSSLTYLTEMLEMKDPPDPREGYSQIADFFTNQNVLITGGSGFIGKVTTEKLLRCCPKIGKIYLFMRAKKGKSPQERFKQHFDETIFMRLKREQPNYGKKVIMVEADMAAEDLALSPEDRQLLRETNVIFHAAASVRFDETLRQITNINIRGTKLLLDFAREMPNLKAFVYVSTAYSFCVRKYIDEKLYTPPISADKLLTLLDTLTDEQLIHLTPKLLGKWPNTYALSKAVGEDTIGRFGDGLPTCIVRPSIVTFTADDPFNGWIDNYYGATGIVLGVGSGLLRSLHCDSECIADIIPVDYVISNMIAAAWDTAQRRNIPPSIADSNSSSETERVVIYNTVSGCQNPIKWGKFMELNRDYGYETPSMFMVWHYMFALRKNEYSHKLAVLFLHMVPAVIVDTILYLSGRKPMLTKGYKKINKFSDVIAYFATQQWRFENKNVMKLWEKMNPVDRAIFNFNLSNLDWHHYFYRGMRGLRVYLAKDPIDTLEEAKKRYRRLTILHYTVLTIFWLLVAWVSLRFYYYIWSFCPLSS